jgi:hypothetical protein
MTKADLMGGFDRIAADPRVTLRRCEEHLESGEMLMDGDLAVFASGGSSGVRALGVEHVVPLAEAWVCGMLRFLLRWTARDRHIPRFILPLLALLRSRSARPSMVGIGAALVSFAVNLAGIGLGPFVAGVASDPIEPRFGPESLRYALFLNGLVMLWAGAHFVIAARTLRDELARARGDEPSAARPRVCAGGASHLRPTDRRARRQDLNTWQRSWDHGGNK